jgi:cytochrome c-type biogenesis protein CcmH
VGVKGIGRYALFAAAALLLVALGYRLRPSGAAGGESPAAAATSAAPTDAAGWRAAGESAFAAGKYPDAVAAYRRATSLQPDDATAWSALGEAQVQIERGVGPTALDAFRRAVKLDPKDPRARYFLAVRRDLDGDHRGAIADWTALLKDAPPGAPWAPSVRDLIQQVAAKEKIAIGPLPAVAAPAVMPGAMAGGAAGAPNAATDAIPGPNAAQLQDAARMSPSEQDGMARAMVDRLAARLADNPRDAAGWMRLMRAKLVLGDQAGAKAALASGKAAFRGDATTTAQLDGAAQALGL